MAANRTVGDPLLDDEGMITQLWGRSILEWSDLLSWLEKRTDNMAFKADGNPPRRPTLVQMAERAAQSEFKRYFPPAPDPLLAELVAALDETKRKFWCFEHDGPSHRRVARALRALYERETRPARTANAGPPSITNADLLRAADKHPAPQSWRDDEDDPYEIKLVHPSPSEEMHGPASTVPPTNPAPRERVAPGQSGGTAEGPTPAFTSRPAGAVGAQAGTSKLRAWLEHTQGVLDARKARDGSLLWAIGRVGCDAPTVREALAELDALGAVRSLDERLLYAATGYVGWHGDALLSRPCGSALVSAVRAREARR